MILPSLLNKNMIYCDILDYCCGKTDAVVYQPSSATQSPISSNSRLSRKVVILPH